VEVSKKVRSIHGIVHNWNPETKISDSFIKDYVQSFTRAFGKEVSILPRTFLKNFVFILEAAKKEPMSKIKALLNISEEQIKEINKQIEVYGREQAMEMEL
jgi:adenosylhomocysteinase